MGPRRHLAHPPSAADVAAALRRAPPEARDALVTLPTPYGTRTDLTRIAEACHEHGVPLSVDEAGAPSRRSTRTALGISGYQAADWIREHHRLNAHIADHRRIAAQLTHAGTTDTTGITGITGTTGTTGITRALITALIELADRAGDFPLPSVPVEVPDPAEPRLEQAMSPRDAYFGPVEDVPWNRAAGRVTAETLTPCPPGIPTALPGERLTAPVLACLRTWGAAGMYVPDAADTTLATVRVVALP
ncbi:hypothetical protein [Streptomyces sp. CBMA291]|uniref:Orn/Lys/Arg family decarboxylase n=1 Tax=unclassified Streptomyces TaxID=2593676 RepID=UPI001DC8BA5B|nr:hypothetical protein [Streptomyces sp. CBMA291]MBD0714195.1 hypothetical protein [Streptomyces sp. CBMA370]